MGEVEPPEDEVVRALNDSQQGQRDVFLPAPVLGSTDALTNVVPVVSVLTLTHLHSLCKVRQVDNVVELEVGRVGRMTSDPRPKYLGGHLAKPLTELLPPRPLLQ